MSWEKDDIKYHFGKWTIHTTKVPADYSVNWYTEVHKRDKITLLNHYWSSHGSHMPFRFMAAIEALLKKPRRQDD